MEWIQSSSHFQPTRTYTQITLSLEYLSCDNNFNFSEISTIFDYVALNPRSRSVRLEKTV